MRDLTKENVTEAVLDKIGDNTEPRVKEIMEALVRHAHDLIKEVNLTSDELLYGARFIQDVGKISDDKREEGVLLGDVLGMTALCEILGDIVRIGATESSLLGPFYRDGAPVREMNFDISLGDLVTFMIENTKTSGIVVKILSIVFIPFSISRYEYSIPNLEDANLASSRLSSLVYGLGIITAFTRLGPRASVAMAATKAESTPPDIPRTTPGKPLLRT